MTADRVQSLLASRGGQPVFPAGPPTWPGADEEVRAILKSACNEGLWGKYSGPFGEALSHALGEMHQVEHVVPCCSGTFAVELALRAVGVKPGDEVVLAAYDFPGNFRAIESVGAVPVLVDIDPQTWCLDIEALRTATDENGVPALNPRTRAIIVSHLHGGLVDMMVLCDLARERKVAVVEDACQAIGARVAGQPAGACGDVGVLSFGGSKLLTGGRGGAILTRDPYILQRARVYLERGNHAFPLSELQAAVLLPQIARLPRLNVVRSQNVHRLLAALNGRVKLEAVRISAPPDFPVFYKLAFACRARFGGPTRDEWVKALFAEGVDIGAGFRGFVKRSSRRCRPIGALACSSMAAAETMVLHHPILLSSPGVMEELAFAFLKVQQGLAEIASGGEKD
jgi:dTDP-4-amino-4,6-dideoxygalactose transaminase